jgi:hypothetical protein
MRHVSAATSQLIAGLIVSSNAFVPSEPPFPYPRRLPVAPPVSGISRTTALQESQEFASGEPPRQGANPIILEPFPEAANPLYPTTGPIGQGEFVVCRQGGPTKEELSNENIMRIVQSQCTDLEVNTLVWKALGYRFNVGTQEWEATECFPNWRDKYPTPPDFIGMQRQYSREIDQISLRSNQALVRSVPVDNKQGLKQQLRPIGWKGYQVS